MQRSLQESTKSPLCEGGLFECVHESQYEEHCSALRKERMEQPRLTGLVFSASRPLWRGLRLNGRVRPLWTLLVGRRRRGVTVAASGAFGTSLAPYLRSLRAIRHVEHKHFELFNRLLSVVNWLFLSRCEVIFHKKQKLRDSQCRCKSYIVLPN